MGSPRNPRPSIPSSAAQAPAGASTLLLGLLGSLLCYLAHPPVDWGLLAWIGPTPWLLAARAPRMPGRRPYRALWLAGALFWLAAIQWLRLPYPANYAGLVFLAAYLGAYLPVFVGLTRVAVHRARAPLWLAAPVVWTGLEWLRARLFSGFLMASLAHTQVRRPRIIQIADLGGEYAVTFLIVLVAASIAQALPLRWVCASSDRAHERLGDRRTPFLALVPAAVALAAAVAYGSWRLEAVAASLPSESHRLALVQSDMLADWKGTPERDEHVMRQQLDLSMKAVRESDRPIDLIVWPETMFRQPLFVRDADNPPPPKSLAQANYAAAADDLRRVVERTGAALLVGIDRVLVSRSADPAGKSAYQLMVHNSAAFVDRNGAIQGTYDKIHLLPFGEFIPFQAWLPFLEKYSPITGNSLWGAAAAAFELDGASYAPSICYETVLPHLIRRQVREIIDRDGRAPDVLVNLTNDAWYWGSSELDMHLASGVFRAVEMRTPLVIAANRGISAYVNGQGRVVAATERDRGDVLVVDVQWPGRRGSFPSFYARSGDWLWATCLAFCAILAALGWRQRMTNNA